jgi:hypothetical protein
LVDADLADAEAVVRGADLARRKFEGAAGFIEALEPRRVGEGQLDLLGSIEVVVEDDRDGHLVAARQRHRQVDIDEERLEDLEGGGVGAEPAVGGDGAGGEAPGGDGVGEVDVECGAAPGVGDELRPPQERFGEPLADARCREVKLPVFVVVPVVGWCLWLCPWWDVPCIIPK